MNTNDEWAGLEALGRLLQVARQDTGQARRVASFLLAWHNAEETADGTRLTSGTSMP